jgi:aminoglycoside phosphotransferase (APT) family kinase protein
VAFDLVDAAAALGAVDIEAVGLADFGRAEDWAVRQVPRWKRQLDGYAAFEGWDPAGLAGIDAVAEWLSDNVPPDHRIGIIHGDLQWANVLIAPDAPRVAAIIDWELSTLGDPLLDLAWILQAWSEPDDPPGHAGSLDGAALPTRAELVARYAASSGRDLTHVRWYEVLACYKLGIILEGSHARACAGKAPKRIGDMLHDYTLWLLRYAAHLIARGDRPA